jgi:hypothetical protein
LSQGDTGMYCVIIQEFKYIYSAADRKEWLLRRWPGKIETRSLIGHPAFEAVQQDLRARLMQRFREDGYEEPLDGEEWRAFLQPDVLANPDAGHLYQDGASVTDWFPEGYHPRVDPTRRRTGGRAQS